MKKAAILILFMIFIATGYGLKAQSVKKYDFFAARKAPMITVDASILEGHSRMKLILKNEGPDNLEASVPAGIIFINPTERDQDVVTLESITMRAKPRSSQEYNLRCACIEAGNGNPSNGQALGEPRLAKGPLMRVAKVADRFKPEDYGLVQSAVWAVTDKREFTPTASSDSGADLAVKLYCAVYGVDEKSLPKDFIVHRDDYQLFSTTLTLNHYSGDKQVRSFFILNGQGDTVQKFYMHKTFSAGRHQEYFSVHQYAPKDEYFIVRLANEYGFPLIDMYHPRSADARPEKLKLDVNISMDINKPLKGAYLVVTDEKGKKLQNLMDPLDINRPKRFSMTTYFEHRMGPDKKFKVKLLYEGDKEYYSKDLN